MQTDTNISMAPDASQAFDFSRLSLAHVGVGTGDPELSRRVMASFVGSIGQIAPLVLLTNGTATEGSNALWLQDYHFMQIDTPEGATPAPVQDVLAASFGHLDIAVGRAAIAKAVADLLNQSSAFKNDINGPIVKVALTKDASISWHECGSSAAALNKDVGFPCVWFVTTDGEIDPLQAVRQNREDTITGAVAYHHQTQVDIRLYRSCCLMPAVSIAEVNETIDLMRDSSEGAIDLEPIRHQRQIDDGLAWDTVTMQSGITDRYSHRQEEATVDIIVAQVAEQDAQAADLLSRVMGGSRPLPDLWTTPQPTVVDIRDCHPWKVVLFINLLRELAQDYVGIDKWLAFDASVWQLPAEDIIFATIETLRTGRKRSLGIVIDLDAHPILRHGPDRSTITGESGARHAIVANLVGCDIVQTDDQRLEMRADDRTDDITSCVAGQDVSIGTNLMRGYWTARTTPSVPTVDGDSRDA